MTQEEFKEYALMQVRACMEEMDRLIELLRETGEWRRNANVTACVREIIAELHRLKKERNL